MMVVPCIFWYEPPLGGPSSQHSEMLHNRLDWQQIGGRPPVTRENPDQNAMPLPASEIQSSRSSYKFEVKVEEVANLVELV